METSSQDSNASVLLRDDIMSPEKLRDSPTSFPGPSAAEESMQTVSSSLKSMGQTMELSAFPSTTASQSSEHVSSADAIGEGEPCRDSPEEDIDMSLCTSLPARPSSASDALTPKKRIVVQWMPPNEEPTLHSIMVPNEQASRESILCAIQAAFSLQSTAQHLIGLLDASGAEVVISGSLPSGIVYSLFTKEETKSTNGNGVHNAATVSAVPLAYEEDARNMREGRSSVKSKRSEFESKDESSTSPDSKSQLKRKRRKAADITRDFKCAYPMCNKFYGSENALRMHIRIKHPDLHRAKNFRFTLPSQNTSPQQTTRFHSVALPATRPASSEILAPTLSLPTAADKPSPMFSEKRIVKEEVMRDTIARPLQHNELTTMQPHQQPTQAAHQQAQQQAQFQRALLERQQLIDHMASVYNSGWIHSPLNPAMGTSLYSARSQQHPDILLAPAYSAMRALTFAYSGNPAYEGVAPDWTNRIAQLQSMGVIRGQKPVTPAPTSSPSLSPGMYPPTVLSTTEAYSSGNQLPSVAAAAAAAPLRAHDVFLTPSSRGSISLSGSSNPQGHRDSWTSALRDSWSSGSGSNTPPGLGQRDSWSSSTSTPVLTRQRDSWSSSSSPSVVTPSQSMAAPSNSSPQLPPRLSSNSSSASSSPSPPMGTPVLVGSRDSFSLPMTPSFPPSPPHDSYREPRMSLSSPFLWDDTSTPTNFTYPPSRRPSLLPPPPP